MENGRNFKFYHNKDSCSLLYKIISFHIVKHFSTDSSPKKKKKYHKQETKIFNRKKKFQNKKKKKKVLSLLDSSLVIVTNNRKSISSHDSRGVPIESSLHNRISKVFLFVYPVPRKGRSSPARPIERDIRFYECLASRLRLLEKKKKKAATGKNRKTRDTRGRGYGRIENIFPAFQHGF